MDILENAHIVTRQAGSRPLTATEVVHHHKLVRDLIVRRFVEKLDSVIAPRTGKVEIVAELNYIEGGLGSLNVEGSSRSCYKGEDLKV